jgi:signal transduction histidine kinase
VTLWVGILRSKKPPVWVAAGIAALLVALMVALRLFAAGKFTLPVGYGVPIVLLGFFRNRKVLWATVGAFAVLTIVKFFILLPEVPTAVHLSVKEYDAIEGLLVLVDLFLVGVVVDVWMISRDYLERQNAQLESGNTDLAAREEEIARQNEELQSQTEELERQSEELRGTNEELAHREKTLETLLALSRALNTEMSTAEIMERICETLGVLINGPTAASAVLVEEKGTMVVRCHHGFGPGGPLEQSILLERSFAALVLGRDRTGYIEDLSLRPDLAIPQPQTGDPLVAILATPLRVRGKAVGSLEVYSRQKTNWSQDQVALVESLAAQTSVSLEAAELFHTVTQQKNRFAAVLQTVPVGIAVSNADLSEVRLNHAGAAMLNVPVDRNIGTYGPDSPYTAYVDGRPMAAGESPLLRAATDGKDTSGYEMDLVLPNNRRLSALTYARPIRDPESGTIRGAVSVFVDITAQKELQRELDIRRREAEEASIRKTRFLAAVSHDIRTPANAISLLAELIRRTASNPAMAADVPELARELHASAVSLVNLLSDVLDLARFDSDKVQLQETEFALAGLLEDERKQLLPLARQKNLGLELDLPPEPLVLRADRIKLSRIVGNLVGNAIKFTETGQVRVGASRNGDGSLHVFVADTGIGIAPEDLAHIFDEFFQLRNPERDRAKGSGLGLTICKRLVDAMGGKLDVQSTPGKGSCFTVALPSFTLVPQR